MGLTIIILYIMYYVLCIILVSYNKYPVVFYHCKVIISSTKKRTIKEIFGALKEISDQEDLFWVNVGIIVGSN